MTTKTSKDLQKSINLKICSLENTNPQPYLVSISAKFEDPTVFKKLSQIYKNSDLFIKISIYDDNNLISLPVQTLYKSFKNKNRQWNEEIELNINYNQVSIDAYLKFEIYEFIDSKEETFGLGCISLFDHDDMILRTGIQQVKIEKDGFINIDYARGNFKELEETEADNYYLIVEFPEFTFPIKYSEYTYDIPKKESIDMPQVVTNTINSITIPQETIYDPEFQFVNSALDPIELKYHKLERNINNNNNLLLDKDIKPTPQLRDELFKILLKPSNAELTDYEKNLIWKFRFYFSRNNASDMSKATKSFLPKFLKSINWDNDYELDHTFQQILPHFWTVDKIQIGDALELLGDYFNPYSLGKQIENVDFESKNLNDDEKRFIKIFNNVCYLRKLAVERLSIASSEELLLYLLQLVQALKYESLIYKQKGDEESLTSPLANFLIESAVENEQLGIFFYWYVKVENEDQLKNPSLEPIKIYSIVLNKFVDRLKAYCSETRKPYYKHIKRQIWFIKKLTTLVELLRTTFKKNESTMRKIEFLRDYLSNSSNELLKFPDPFPLPLDPSIMVCGVYPQESSVFKSSLAPLKITLKTIEKKSTSTTTSQIFGKKSHKYGKYPLMFKIGDDLRQDQLVIQIINLMDQLLKNENLDLKLTPYKILAISPNAGLIQFVPNETLDSILSKNFQAPNLTEDGNSGNGILSYLKFHSQHDELEDEPVSKSVYQNNSNIQTKPKSTITSNLGVNPIIMDNYVKSCAGYCVITYILGVGDRHLDNLLLSPNGKFWHADFGYILGRDPKPFPPLMKLPIQVIDGMGGLQHENYNIFKNYCFITYTTLRKNSNLILNLFQLMIDANIPDIKFESSRVVEKVEEKFNLQMTEEEAILHFQNLINDSVNAFLPVVIDRLHSLAQYWRA
ncbi:unnamed protein product [Candida verbasci]|uniref:Phosphatidylinositol 3-kinase VPS34 n=1 Tax=Candida verbasci TaxID=1227364 RepID=A0A9W4XKU6_9ASCO|nr:unnamed protein product [Candida verbasci]